MDEARRTEIRVGIVSLVAVAVLIVGILLGQGISLSPNNQLLKIRLKNSGGLDVASPVVINGVKRGQVKDVISNNGSVLVLAEVDDISDIHPDAFATVSILEITGGKKVEINPGFVAGTWDPEQEMVGRATADLGGLISLVGDVSGDLVNLVRRLDTISAAATELLADGTVTANIKSMTADGAILIKDAREWVQTNRNNLTNSIEDMRIVVADIKRIVKNNEPKLTSTMDKLDKMLTDLEVTIAKTDRAIVNVDTLVTNINGVVMDIKTNDGLVNAMLYDSTFKGRIDTLVASVRHFVKDARKNGVNVNIGLGHK